MPQPLNPETAFSRAAARCSVAECCCADWRRKFSAAGLMEEEINAVLQRLQEEGYINEERYARAFAHDKAHYERWGQKKISMALMQKGIPSNFIAAALAELEEEVWKESLETILERKNRTLKAESEYERRQKLARYAASRGFGSEETFRAIDKLFNEVRGS